MTPEEFLAQQGALAELASGLQLVYAMVATIRSGFLEQSGVGEAAADDLTAAICREVFFPMMRPKSEP